MIGLGHMMRCLAMAEWANSLGLQAVLLSREIPGAVSKMLQEHSVTAVTMPVCHAVTSSFCYPHSHWLTGTQNQDAVHTLSIIEQQITERASNPLFVMVDHYALGAPWEKKLSIIAPILVIDDLNDRPHQCRWLVDQTFGKSSKSYENLVNSGCDIKIGPKFALLRSEFEKQSNIFERKAPSADEELRILITLGGVDVDNVTGQVLLLLSEMSIIKSLSITIVVGGANPHLEGLSKLCEQIGCKTNLIINSQEMAKLMTLNDVCIGAAGSTSWERCALGLPTLNLILAENQQQIAVNLDEIGAVVNLGRIEEVSVERIEALLTRYHHNQDVYLKLAKICQKISDGLGCKRILNMILDV